MRRNIKNMQCVKSNEKFHKILFGASQADGTASFRLELKTNVYGKWNRVALEWV